MMDMNKAEKELTRQTSSGTGCATCKFEYLRG